MSMTTMYAVERAERAGITSIAIPFLADLSVTVEGFDPVTGKNHMVGADGSSRGPGNYQDTSSDRRPRPGRSERSERPSIARLHHGTLKAPEPSATFWCTTTVKYELSPPTEFGLPCGGTPARRHPRVDLR